MATATIGQSWREVCGTRTVRHFGLALAFAGSAVVVGVLLYVVEKYLIDPEHRFVENPVSVMMRSVGLAHFWIGWLFLLTSPRLRQGNAVVRLISLICVGALLCWVCAICGASDNPFIYLFFYSYFLVHEIRDQTSLYQAYGEAPDDGRESRAFLRVFSLAAIVCLTTVLIAGYLLHTLVLRRMPLLMGLSPWYYTTLLLCLCGLCWGMVNQCIEAGRVCHGSARRAVMEHLPIAVVYMGIFSVLLFGLVLNTAAFSLIILIHAGAWLTFVTYRLQKGARPQRRNLWTWVRYTPAGFVTLHVAVIVFVLVMMAIRVHLWQRVGFVSELFATSSFPYWSLMHITTAFWKPKS